MNFITEQEILNDMWEFAFDAGVPVRDSFAVLVNYRKVLLVVGWGVILNMPYTKAVRVVRKTPHRSLTVGKGCDQYSRLIER
jgi:hypothetical protein